MPSTKKSAIPKAAGPQAVKDAKLASESGERTPARNEVVLSGRVAATAVERELPSGDCVMTARVIVDRSGPAAARSGQRVDTIDCVAWTVRVQRSMRNWEPGDEVEVHGALRRRFFRGSDGPRSRFEVEILRTKRLRRP